MMQVKDSDVRLNVGADALTCPWSQRAANAGLRKHTPALRLPSRHIGDLFAVGGTVTCPAIQTPIAPVGPRAAIEGVIPILPN